MSVQRNHRAQLKALLLGETGETGHTLAAGMFRYARKGLDVIDRTGVERAVRERFEPYKPLGGYNNPLDGRDLSTREIIVRVGYRLDPDGSALTYDASGADSGAADLDSVEDRAEMDAKLIRDVVAWQPNWTGLDPSVIDVMPHPEGDPALIELEDRAIREVRFVMLTRASLPGDYGPSQ